MKNHRHPRQFRSRPFRSKRFPVFCDGCGHTKAPLIPLTGVREDLRAEHHAAMRYMKKLGWHLDDHHQLFCPRCVESGRKDEDGRVPAC